MSLAVALPGRAYPVTLQAVAAVTDVLAGRGYDVRPVSWGLLDQVPDDADRWVVDRLLEALDGAEPDLVVAKSLGTRAASYAATRGWPAVWVTPLLRDAACAAGVRDNPAPQLLVCGGADPLHDPAVAASLAASAGPVDVLELAGVDHALSASGDGAVAPEVVARVASATEDLLGRLA